MNVHKLALENLGKSRCVCGEDRLACQLSAHFFSPSSRSPLVPGTLRIARRAGAPRAGAPRPPAGETSEASEEVLAGLPLRSGTRVVWGPRAVPLPRSPHRPLPRSPLLPRSPHRPLPRCSTPGRGTLRTWPGPRPGLGPGPAGAEQLAQRGRSPALPAHRQGPGGRGQGLQHTREAGGHGKGHVGGVRLLAAVSRPPHRQAAMDDDRGPEDAAREAGPQRAGGARVAVRGGATVTKVAMKSGPRGGGGAVRVAAAFSRISARRACHRSSRSAKAACLAGSSPGTTRRLTRASRGRTGTGSAVVFLRQVGHAFLWASH